MTRDIMIGKLAFAVREFLSNSKPWRFFTLNTSILVMNVLLLVGSGIILCDMEGVEDKYLIHDLSRPSRTRR